MPICHIFDAMISIFGTYARHRLLAIREEGEVEEKVVLSQVHSEARKAVRHVPNVAGLRQQYCFPPAKLESTVAHRAPDVSVSLGTGDATGS
jgi:hypothetical protein